MRRGKIVDFLMLFVFLASLAVGSALLAKFNSQEIIGNARVLDGDSLVVSGVEVRLHGIDAPEYRQECQIKGASDFYKCGFQAAKFLRQMVAGKDIICSGHETDKYDRLLGQCMIGDVQINREMVINGWAVSFGDYEKEEAKAKKTKVGLWRGDFELPKDWRRAENEKHSKGWIGWISSW